MRKFSLLLAMLLLVAAITQGQTKEVTGKIVDSTGAPVQGASIKIKGAKNGTSAGQDGTFRIVVPVNATLQISGVGYDLLEIKASAVSGDILLSRTSRQLSEVVVTALGIKREKRSLATATQTIGTDELNKSGTGNPLSELNGKASGLTVINSTGDPGGGTYIRLRGVTSITGTNQPLIVIDGVPIDNSVNNYDPTNSGFLASGANADLTGGAQPTNRGVDINPNDIESITLLKGPAATALYGIQAASGAIIITTKKGGQGSSRRTSVSFNSSVTFDKVSNLPPLQNRFAQGSHGAYLGPETGASISWGPALDTLFWDGATDYPFDKHGNIVGKSDPAAKIPVHPYDVYSFFQTGITYNNNIALTGGNDKSGYRMSLGNLYQTGIIPLSKYVKTTFSLSGQADLTSKLKVSGSATYITSTNNKVQQGSSLSSIMLGLTRTPPTFDNSNGLSNPAGNPASYEFPDGTQRNYRGGGGYDNPYWTVNKNPFTEVLNRVFGFGQASFQALDWLNFTYRLGADVYSQDSKNVYDKGSNQFPGGVIYLIDYLNHQYNSDFIVNMHKSFSKDWSGSLILGHNYFTSSQVNRFNNGNGIVLPGFYDISNFSSYVSTETEINKRTMAFYGEAQLTYQEMFYLTVTGRRETSSTLPAGNNSFFYPSASIAWVFTELEGMKDNSILNFGKLRLSFAQVGKDAPVYALTTPYAPTNFKDGFTTGIVFPIPSSAGFQISNVNTTLGNPNLKPENTYSYEGGADLSFLKNRINLSLTAYYSKSTDVIFQTSVPYSTGFAAELLNAATLSNKGLEITLNTTPVKTHYGLRWDLNFNWSRNVNKVEALTPGINRFFVAGFGGGEAEIDAVVGQPFGVIYGSTTPHVNLMDLKSPLLINDVPGTGYGQPLAGGVGPNQVIGNTNPAWFGSVISNLTYKGFAFGLQIDVRHGGQMWNGTRGALTNKGKASQTGNRGTPTVFKGLLGHLDVNGNVVHYAADGVTELPGAGATNSIQSSYNQFYWQNVGNSFGGGQETDVEDASFVRIRQISLTYELVRNVIKKSPFSSLSLTVFANNPRLWTKYDGVDPETSLTGPANAQGLDYFNSPGTKSYGIRLNVGL